MSLKKSLLIVLSIILLISSPGGANEVLIPNQQTETLPTSTSPYVTSTDVNRLQQDEPNSNAITFSEFPLGTYITSQYFNRGVIFEFEGVGPFIANDSSNPTSPVLSGTPRYLGAIEGRFVNPNDGITPIAVSSFSLDAGYFDALGTTCLEWFDRYGYKIGEQINSAYGIEHFVIDEGHIASWRISIMTSELLGFAIDNLNIDFGFNLWFRKTDDVNAGDCVEPGNEVTYTIDYNYPIGPDLPNVSITDYLPDALEFILSEPAPDEIIDSNKIIWNIGTLRAGDTMDIMLKVGVKKDAKPDSVIVNRCEISSNGVVRDWAYECTSVCSPILTEVNNITGCVSPVDDINYSICYDANGYGDTNVVITDILPGEVSFVSASGDYEYNYPVVSWDIGTLEPNESGCVTLQVKVKPYVEPGSLIANRYEIKSGEEILKSVCQYTPVCCNCPVVEDFNSYADTGSLREIWKLNYNSGATNTIETATACFGQSMKYKYDDIEYYYYFSEVYADTADLPSQIGSDWVGGGAEALAMYFYGQPEEGEESEDYMYVKLTDGDGNEAVVLYDGEVNDINDQQWHQWSIDLSEFSGADLNDVARITIGFGDGAEPDTYGTVYFDDIRLYPPAGEGFELPGADLDGDFVVDLYDLKILMDEWLNTDYYGEADLYEDNKIDFKDFSVLSSEWGLKTEPCDDTTPSGRWRDLFFTGICACGGIGCWIEENEGEPVFDECHNRLRMVCEPTPELGYYCAYNYYFGWNTRVGFCVYKCGLNAFQVMRNTNGTRILRTRHRTQDQMTYYCDEETDYKYNWQIVVYDALTGERTGYCRQSYLDPNEENFWEPDEGEPGPCKIEWW
ncbi:MAG: hypothetical protein PHY02_01895 [Phycisphaerae bacterium]|nr:hypothetical protein [Phycisphaerae bacterium]